MIKIKGRYYHEPNSFTTVYADNRMYTLAPIGDWTYVAVGETMDNGWIITQELYDTWKSECNITGTFLLNEERGRLS